MTAGGLLGTNAWRITKARRVFLLISIFLSSSLKCSELCIMHLFTYLLFVYFSMSFMNHNLFSFILPNMKCSWSLLITQTRCNNAMAVVMTRMSGAGSLSLHISNVPSQSRTNSGLRGLVTSPLLGNVAHL